MKSESTIKVAYWAMVITTFANVPIAGATENSFIALLYLLVSIGLWKFTKELMK